MSRPHILIVNVYFAPFTYGGATIVAEQVGKALHRDHGYRVTAISAMSRSDLAPYSILKTEVDGIVNYLINLPFGRSYALGYSNPKVTQLMAELMQQLNPDLVHVHCVQDLGVGVISAAKNQGRRVILSTHDFWWLCERQFMIRMDGTYCQQDPIDVTRCAGCVDSVAKARERQNVLMQTAAQADLLTFPSKFAHDLCTRSGLVAKENIVWTNGVHLPKSGFFEQQTKRRNSNDRLAFGFVGGPSQIKGWPIIRQAFEMLKTDQEIDVFVVDGSLDGSWWPDISFEGLAGNWSVVPRFSQDEMDSFYTKIDVLLFMSQWRETFGLTIREALARGIRIIHTDSGGTTEHARANKTHMPKIGDGPGRLLVELERMIKGRDDHPTPLLVESFADQAAVLAEWNARHLNAPFLENPQLRKLPY